MATTLSKPVLISPVLVGDTLSVDVDLLPLIVHVDAASVAVELVIAETGQLLEFTDYLVVNDTTRQFKFEAPIPLEEGAYHFSIRSKNASGGAYSQVSPGLTLTVVRAVNPDVEAVQPPAGVVVQRLANFVRVRWQKPTMGGFLGTRVLFSTDSSGVNVPYTQWGDLITASAAVQHDTLLTRTAYEASADGLHRVTTKDETLVDTPYSQVDFPASQVNAQEFYVYLTTVTQDPVTHHIHESYGIGPFRCAFVDLRRVRPADIPPGFTPENFAVNIVSEIAKAYPSLDLTPRSEERDIQVDPVSLELANASTRLWYAEVCQSVDALLAVDDADGDGVSDSVPTSTYKQALTKAFRLSDAQVQVMIDKQFDVLGAAAGVSRGGAQAAIVDVTFYVNVKPTKRITISKGAVVNTLPDATTPSIAFKTLGSAVIDPGNASSYYNAAKARWEVTLPCICTVEGSIGVVSGGTVRTVISGTSSPMLCTNDFASDFGLDRESNANYAARIIDRQVVGVDSGRRLGYKSTALKSFRVIQAEVVCAGDLEMLRDWDDMRQKHVFGCVDIYARGSSLGQEVLRVPYTHDTAQTYQDTSTYRAMRIIDSTLLHIGFTGEHPEFPCAALVELASIRQDASTLNFYFGVDRARFDSVTNTFFLDPDDLTYTREGDTVVQGVKNSQKIGSVSSSDLKAIVSLWSPLSALPTNQPVGRVYSVVGDTSFTGAVPASLVRLIKSDDPMLNGGSIKAKDRVVVNNDTSVEVLSVVFPSAGAVTQDLGEGVALTIGQDGLPTGLKAVRSADGLVLYTFNKDYTVVPLGQFGHYGIKWLSTGTIPQDVTILVTVDRYRFREHLTLRHETLTVTGSVPTPLAYAGVVLNIWQPLAHGLTGLVNDSALVASTNRSLRYIKVLYDNGDGPLVMVEGRDYVLTTDPATKQTYISRYISSGTVTSRIPDGGVSLDVTYYSAEVFDISTRYPQFVQQISQDVEEFKHGGADVLVKAMQENLVDMHFVVETTTRPEIVDKPIRTAITRVFDAARGKLTQAELVRHIKAVPGVKNVQLPFRRMAKADESYDVGLIIPTGTQWLTMTQMANTDGAFDATDWNPRTWITKDPVVRYKTRPSGGYPDAYVGLLYEGEAYKRMLNIAQIKATGDAAFYVIGINDYLLENAPVGSEHYGKLIIVTPKPSKYRELLTNPGEQAFRLTYQVFGEAGTADIPVGPTEYLRPGKITIDYVES